MEVHVYTAPGWFSCRTLEAFLSDNGVDFQNHNIAVDQAAREELKSRGISSAPVTIIDGEAIIGYYPKKLIPALNLDITLELGSSVEWVADKYERIMAAAVRTVAQLSEENLEVPVSWRPQTMRQHMLHVLSFPELAYLSHKTGSMSTDDMRANGERIKGISTVAEIMEYGEKVQKDIANFFNTADSSALDLVVPAHYGGEVTVLELMNIILRHSTHHLNQSYWFMEETLGITVTDKMTEEDLEGIATPTELI